MVRLTPNPVVYMCIIKHLLSDPKQTVLFSESPETSGFEGK